MANKTDVYKANINICDTHRRYFGRMRLGFHQGHAEGANEALLRVLASCLHADDKLQMTAGAIEGGAPSLFIKDCDGSTRLWVCLGKPTLGELTRACRESVQVAVLGIEDAAWQRWWAGLKNKIARLANLSVASIDECTVEELLPCLEKRMRWQGVLDHETLWLHHDKGITEVTPQYLKTAHAPHRLRVA